MPENHKAATEASAQPQRTGDTIEYARLLQRVDLFADVDRVALAKLAANLQPLRYAKSSIIFSEGDVGDAFYLMAGGSVGVYLSDSSDGGKIPVRILRAGEPFGEMALLTNSPRTGTIKAEEDCEVLRLERSAFLNLVRDQPGVALAIAATLSRRLARTRTKPSERTPPELHVRRQRPIKASSQPRLQAFHCGDGARRLQPFPSSSQV